MKRDVACPGNTKDCLQYWEQAISNIRSSIKNGYGKIDISWEQTRQKTTLSQGVVAAVNLQTVQGDTFWIQPDQNIFIHAARLETFAAQAKIIAGIIIFGPKSISFSLHKRRRVKTFLRKRMHTMKKNFEDHSVSVKMEVAPNAGHDETCVFPNTHALSSNTSNRLT